MCRRLRNEGIDIRAAHNAALVSLAAELPPASASRVLAALAARTPLLGAQTLAYVDVDSLLRRIYGPAKQGAAFGHAKVGGYNVKLRGLSPLVAAISADQAAAGSWCAATRRSAPAPWYRRAARPG